MLAGGVLAFAATQGRQISLRRDVSRQAAESHCSGASDCADKNLQTQVRAANASEDGADLALWQLAFNLAGLGGLGFTVYYAHLAWRESQASAKTAVLANKMAREAFEADQRAWMDIDGFAIEAPGLVWTDGSGRIALEVHAKNVGRTPAIEVWFDLRLHVDVTKSPLAVRDQMIAQGSALNGVGHTIFPNKKFIQSVSVEIAAAAISEYAANMAASGAGAFNTNILFPFVIGVLSYRPMPGMDRRHTAIIMHIKNGASDIGEAFRAGDNVSHEAMKLARFPVGDMLAT
jgi:hypothetical protein